MSTPTLNGKLLDPLLGLAGLTAEPRQQLTAVFDKLAALDGSQRELGRKAEALRREIPRIEERLDPLDDEGVIKLEGKKNQLAMVEKRMVEFNERRAEILNELDVPVNRSILLFGEVGKREFEALKAHVNTVLTPLCHDQGEVAAVMCNIPVLQDAQSINRLWYYVSDKVELGRRCMAWLDTLSKGQNPGSSHNQV